MTPSADELASRPAKKADYARENQSLLRLARAQTGSREDLLNAIAREALALCCAGSAGISLVEGPADSRCFRWLAVAGLCSGLQGRTTAWDECPCGVTLEAGAARLFVDPQRQFACLNLPGVDVPEGIVVPIPSDHGHLGAIWVMSHSSGCRFDSEDARVLSDLATLAGAAVTMVNVRDDGADNDRRHNEFIAMLAHELRNPMAPIDGAIAAARRLVVDNDKADAVLSIAQRQMKHLRTLVDDLLDAARLKYGKLTIRRSDTLLAEIVSDAVATIEHDLRSRGHKLKLTGLDSVIPVRADPVRLSQVLGNLLSNAAKYTPAGGLIELTVRAEDPPNAEMLVIDVSDNGIGIDSSIAPRVFDLFAQCSSASTLSEGGLGIGLAVAKRLVELHDGEIAIHSDGLGCGTRVTLRLPILRTPPRAAPGESVDKGSELRTLRIVLVDDNVDALHVLCVLLDLEGYRVSAVDNGRAAIELISRTRPELAIVDVAMPVMDGFEVARRIRANPELNGTILVALTGYSSESDRSQALAAGFDHHLSKPLSLEKLRDVLANSAQRPVRGDR
ncbi:hybrid sensor histidine kinase/response regulator [Paraburkholderia sp. HD33-4]|uniref:hybrid sensor histidine kinase/response regulator n=1 Tax=Paraburkholderia sp. HD33-4 TaxID=2883242 RepID=UPI001F2E7916|nr:ATP-binding protein [Paraburkholderia sp. HD33-4]